MSSIIDKTKNIGRKSTGGAGPAKVAHHKHHNIDGDRPSDHLINRGEQQRLIVKSVHDFYAAVASSERHAAAELTKAAAALPIPFVHGAQFSQDEEGGGWQATLYKVREHARALSAAHEEFAKSIDANVLADLNRTKHTVKAHTKEVAEVSGKHADEVDAQREASTKALSKHGAAIAVVGRNLAAPKATDDPYITNDLTHRQLVKQVGTENELTKSNIYYTGLAEKLDTRFTEEIKGAAKDFKKAHERALETMKSEWNALDQSLASVDATADWPAFKNLKGAFVAPDAPIRDASLIDFPHKDHEASGIAWEGPLERKKRFAKKYEELHVVITKTGFLHTFKPNADQDAPKAALPELSLYLPNFSLGPAAEESSSKHKFYLEGKKSTKSGAEATMKKFGLGGRDHAYTFRAPTHGQMMTVWGELEPLTREVINVTPAEVKKSAVPAAVANAGLAPALHGSTYHNQTASDDGVITHTDAADDTESVVSPTSGPAADDDEERGGSSDEEEEFVAAPAGTTPAAVTTHEPVAVASTSSGPSALAQPLHGGDNLPQYASGGVEAPSEKKVAFTPNSDSAASAPLSTGHAEETSSSFRRTAE